IANTYKFDPFSQGFVEVLAAQQTNEAADWYQGTADAVRQQLRYVLEDRCTEVLILSGDQLYRMDYRHLLKTHRDSGADATLALAAPPPPFDLHRPVGFTYTHIRNVPASRVTDARLKDALVSDGCVVDSGSRVERCVAGVRSRVARGVTPRDTVMVGASWFA